MSRISVINGALSFYTPSLDLSICEKALTSRLTAAMGFESTYQLFATSNITSANFKDGANLALQKSKDVDAQYGFLSSVAKGRYQDAKLCLQQAKADFKFVSDGLPAKTAAFKRGIEDWKSEKSIQAGIKGLFVVAELVLSIGAMMALGVPLPAGGAVEDLANESKAIVELKDFLEKFGDLVEKVGQIVDYSTEMSELAESFKGGVDDVNGDDLKEPHGVSNPELVIAGWDTFRDKLIAMFDEIPTAEIPFAGDYKLTLLEMANLGKAIASCQKAVIQAGDEYTRMLVALRVSQADTARLVKAVDKLTIQESLLTAFKSALFSKLLMVRSWIFLDFQQYVAAYMYFALADAPPIKLSALKAAASYAGDAATLQAAVAMASLLFRGQLDDGIVFKTGDKTGANIFPPDWKQQLVKKRALAFNIKTDDARFRRYERVRIQRLRVYFDFLPGTSPTTESVTLHVTLNPQILDRGPRPSFASKSYFLMDKIELDFAYFPIGAAGGDAKIKVDGVFADAERFVRPTPFTEWTVQAVDDDLDLANVSGLRLELACEFS